MVTEPSARQVGWVTVAGAVMADGGAAMVTEAVSVQLVRLSVTVMVYVPSAKPENGMVPLVCAVPENVSGPVTV